MKYMGSKARHAKQILPIILKDRSEDQYFVDLFAGGFNLIDKVIGNRIANDIDIYITSMFKSLQKGWLPPDLITEDRYNNIRSNIQSESPDIIGYVGYGLSFGGKFFGGYRRDVAGSKGDINNMKKQSGAAKRSLIKQKDFILNIEILNSDYRDVVIPSKSIVYLDPPYKGTTRYKSGEFNHNDFYEYCRILKRLGHNVFVSEYDMPSDFKEVWSCDVKAAITNQTSRVTGIEKLFTL